MTHEDAVRHFSYDHYTGKLTNRIDRHLAKAGDESGFVCRRHGYRFVKFNGERIAAHRLIWLIVHAHLPRFEIDHINGIKHDNRLENLRDVPHQINVQNLRGCISSSSTGLLGVGPKGRKWRARITVNKVVQHLGTFETKEQAIEAYITAKRYVHTGCTI